MLNRPNARYIRSREPSSVLDLLNVEPTYAATQFAYRQQLASFRKTSPSSNRR